jgi:hypothetical protein
LAAISLSIRPGAIAVRYPIIFAVTKSDVLARVAEDLAAGNTQRATQRLRTLVAAVPNDLEVYGRLTEVYRQIGNLAEAGRWGFVTDDVTDQELSAFEKTHPSPWLRLRMLRWTANANEVADDNARERMSALVALARQSGPPQRYQGVLYNGESHHTAPALFVTTVLLLFSVVGGIGAFHIVYWMLY